jgi:hypothetical protein
MSERPRKLLDQVADAIRRKHYSYRRHHLDESGLQKAIRQAALRIWCEALRYSEPHFCRN